VPGGVDVTGPDAGPDAESSTGMTSAPNGESRKIAATTA